MDTMEELARRNHCTKALMGGDAMKKSSWLVCLTIAAVSIPVRAARSGVVVVSDTSWRAIAPAGNMERRSIGEVGEAWEDANPGWNSSLTYSEPPATDGATWRNAIHVDHSEALRTPLDGSQTIWYDGLGSNGSTPSYFRKTFRLSAKPAHAILEFGADDDAQVYLNGTLVIDDANRATDIRSVENASAIDVTEYLREGDNLLAVKAQDSYGFREWIMARLDVQSAPEPATPAIRGTRGLRHSPLPPSPSKQRCRRGRRQNRRLLVR